MAEFDAMFDRITHGIVTPNGLGGINLVTVDSHQYDEAVTALLEAVRWVEEGSVHLSIGAIMYEPVALRAHPGIAKLIEAAARVRTIREGH